MIILIYNVISMNKPPFEITNYILNKVIDITNKVNIVSSYQLIKRMPILRRNNKIKSLHSSLVIEANSLSLDQVNDIISGKLVYGPKNEIQEVKNAYEAYNLIKELDCFEEPDLLKAHNTMTKLLINDSGKYRKHGEAIYDNQKVIFVAPPDKIVPKLVSDLFNWLKNDNETPLLIKSCVFHYEFVFIHPFSDGNGRMARLWQNLILTKWNEVFEYIPIESQILKYQDKYYDAIDLSNKRGNSTIFVEFMLDIIDKTLDEMINDLSKSTNNISDELSKLLNVMEKDIPYSANDLLKLLNIKTKETLRSSYLNLAIKNNLIKMTIPDKPNSKNQKYIKI